MKPFGDAWIESATAMSLKTQRPVALPLPEGGYPKPLPRSATICFSIGRCAFSNDYTPTQPISALQLLEKTQLFGPTLSIATTRNTLHFSRVFSLSIRLHSRFRCCAISESALRPTVAPPQTPLLHPCCASAPWCRSPGRVAPDHWQGMGCLPGKWRCSSSRRLPPSTPRMGDL